MSDDASVSSYETLDDKCILNYDNYQHEEMIFRVSSLRGFQICPYDPSPSETEWRDLGQAIGRSTEIGCLRVSMDGLEEDDEIASADNLEAFVGSVANNRSLKELMLEIYDLRVARLGLLHPFVIENDNLVKLSLVSCNFSLHDLQMLAAAFSQRRNPTSIKALDISGDYISDESVPVIIDICGYCPHLQRLDLGYSSIGNRGLSLLTTLLANPECKLKDLSLAGMNGIDDEVARVLSNSLVNNNKLKMLDLGISRNNPVTPTGWKHFFEILRNKSNINATSSSNHTLCSLGGRYARRSDLPKDLEFCLHLNEETNKKYVIREKIFHYHLNDTDMAPLFGADQEILPDLLGWIGKDNTYSYEEMITAFYRIIRSFPDLCGFETYDRKMRNKLEAENTIIKVEVATLKAENASIKAENTTIKSEVVTLRAENANLKAENEELLRKIEQLTMGKVS